MADARLRELERRWLETRAPEAGARLDQELSRSGQSPVEQVVTRLRLERLAVPRFELAVYLRHPLALAVLASGGEDPPEDQLALDAWVQGVGQWGKEASLRSGCAAAGLLIARWEARFPSEPAPLAALRAAETWLSDPSEARAAHALAAAQAVWLLGDPEARRRDPAAAQRWDEAWPDEQASSWATAVTSATGSAAYAARADREAAPSWAANAAVSAAEALGIERGTLDWRAARELGEPLIREAIREVVGAWALG